MKTIDYFKTELAELESSANPHIKSPLKKQQRYKFVKLCLMYLESNPRESFLISEIDRLKKEVLILESRYDIWFKNLTTSELDKIKNPVKFYADKFEITTKNRQVAAIQYILGN